jgi:hypothetical protein
MYKNPLFLYTVFHKPSYCPYLRQSGRFPWRWLYNNGQFPEAEVGAGWSTGGSNERKEGFGKWRIAYSLLRYIVGCPGDGSGGSGPGSVRVFRMNSAVQYLSITIRFLFLNRDHDLRSKTIPEDHGSIFYFHIGSRFFRKNRSAIFIFKTDRD